VFSVSNEGLVEGKVYSKRCSRRQGQFQG
jgi:hypothetical protein